MKFKVYHKEDDVAKAIRALYVLVAEVEADSLEDVLYLVNDSDRDYDKITIKAQDMRDTGSGDIVVDESGTAHVCNAIGWTALV